MKSYLTCTKSRYLLLFFVQQTLTLLWAYWLLCILLFQDDSAEHYCLMLKSIPVVFEQYSVEYDCECFAISQLLSKRVSITLAIFVKNGTCTNVQRIIRPLINLILQVTDFSLQSYCCWWRNRILDCSQCYRKIYPLIR